MSDIPEIGGVKKGANDNSETLWGQAVAYYTTFWESLEFTTVRLFFHNLYSFPTYCTEQNSGQTVGNCSSMAWLASDRVRICKKSFK